MAKYHKYTSGAKTKGWIKNNTTGVKKSFQFNPTELEYSRGTTFSEIVAPGIPYPLTQFGHGNVREFSVTLFMYDNPNTGKIAKYEKFLNGFLPPETNTSKGFIKPPDMTICVGKFIRRCVLTELSVAIRRIDEDGNPIQAEFTLSLRQVGV